MAITQLRRPSFLMLRRVRAPGTPGSAVTTTQSDLAGRGDQAIGLRGPMRERTGSHPAITAIATMKATGVGNS